VFAVLQGIDGAEASGLLSAAISSIRTVTAFNMQQSIQAGYSKVSLLETARNIVFLTELHNHI
jgi:hypothetical protein